MRTRNTKKSQGYGRNKMKKILVILIAVIGFGVIANAQCTTEQCGVSGTIQKFGVPGNVNDHFGGPTAAYFFTNNNDYEVTVQVKIKAVAYTDGEVKYYTETFTLKPYSSKTTTVGKYAVIDTHWTMGINCEKSTMEIECL